MTGSPKFISHSLKSSNAAVIWHQCHGQHAASELPALHFALFSAKAVRYNKAFVVNFPKGSAFK